MSVSIGEMRHRLALQQPHAEADGGGGTTRTWALVAEVWGAIRPLSGNEVVEADGVHGQVSHEIWIRHRTGVVPEMRFALGARVFEIRAVIDVNEQRRFLRCLAEERVP
ncbi:phage head closure protein [Hyphomicrobium sp. CS1GBMeth3]|uniref:phage head closure protein n=1 Tax=Hyphomicrobium sp. CS1GBMeth3 TaxID=1892845 RepID=UPI0009FA42BF|nr:phage head closure protein [Hyphomicrobium sp. CS1GBMeth3]